MKKLQSRKPSVKSRDMRLSKRKRRSRLHVLKFLPALVLIGLAISISIQPKIAQQPHNGVLSYSTNISPGDLLSGTNGQRSGNGLGTLSIDSQLMAAAQNKANDMVARNYWSHITPDGAEPWTFITGAGYQYTTAGENLAYGFDTSADTITGWMNSAPHRANILNGSYTQVGFGIANSANFNNDGQQTIVVAMYASPQASQRASAAPQTTGAPPSSQTPVSSIQDTATPAQTASVPITPTETLATSQTDDKSSAALAKTTAAVSSKPVRKIQIITGGKASWSAFAVVVGALALGLVYAMQRGLRIKKLALAGERFIAHHIYLDVTVAAILMLSVALVTTVGNIR
jgi:hypothetical protein